MPEKFNISFYLVETCWWFLIIMWESKQTISYFWERSPSSSQGAFLEFFSSLGLVERKLGEFSFYECNYLLSSTQQFNKSGAT